MPASDTQKILIKLDQILRVISIQVAEGKSITERARLLKLAGLDNFTIAAVLNTSVPVIRTLTAKYREVRGASRGPKKEQKK